MKIYDTKWKKRLAYVLSPPCPSDALPFIMASLVTSKMKIKNPRDAETAVAWERKNSKKRVMWFGEEFAYANDSERGILG
jgi:hypothetical protein